MRRAFLCCLIGFASSMGAFARGHNDADYTLRVHVFQVSTHSHYRQGVLDYVDGEGRANLFENGQPRGFDFGFRCRERLMTSAGYETYLARWKKAGKEVEILLPVMGRPGAGQSCGLKVVMKEGVYYRHSGALEEEPVATFKAWMESHQYDPEHGKNEPVNTPAATDPKQP